MDLDFPEDQIEQNKDKTNLGVEVGFVGANYDRYWNAWEAFSRTKPDSIEVANWAEEIDFGEKVNFCESQLTPAECVKILSCMPIVMRQLSKLKKVQSYAFVPVPGFDENGNLDTRKVEMVFVDDFPREQDHPERVLIGNSDGVKIRQTPIPSSVSSDVEARKMYQRHVFLHEFFHTIDYPLRVEGDREASEANRQEVQLIAVDGQLFTLQDWWYKFECLMCDQGITPPSIYASSFDLSLNWKTKESDYDTFQQAVAEQICESFVGYYFNLLPNEEGYDDFKEAKPELWALIDKLVNAQLLTDSALKSDLSATRMRRHRDRRRRPDDALRLDTSKIFGEGS